MWVRHLTTPINQEMINVNVSINHAHQCYPISCLCEFASILLTTPTKDIQEIINASVPYTTPRKDYENAS